MDVCLITIISNIIFLFKVIRAGNVRFSNIYMKVKEQIDEILDVFFETYFLMEDGTKI